MKETFVIIKTQFSAIHSWEKCPIKEVAFLRNKHRHVFHVTMKIKVNHNDRDIEFIQAKNRLNHWLRANWEQQDLGQMSCEMMAETLFTFFSDVKSVEVMEDNENGAIVELSEVL